MAAVSVEGGLRRQIHVELSKEKIIALDLSVDRVTPVPLSKPIELPVGTHKVTFKLNGKVAGSPRLTELSNTVPSGSVPW